MFAGVKTQAVLVLKGVKTSMKLVSFLWNSAFKSEGVKAKTQPSKNAGVKTSMDFFLCGKCENFSVSKEPMCEKLKGNIFFDSVFRSKGVKAERHIKR